MPQDHTETAPVGLGASAQAGAPASLTLLVRHAHQLVWIPLVCAALALGGSYLIEPTFTARTSFIPPQQQQSAAASALASLGALASIAGGSLGSSRTPADQYVSLLQSITLSDRMIDGFGLMSVYDTALRVDARRQLEKYVRIALGRRDGLIVIEVDDKSPKRAADMANRYVDELRNLTSKLALTEAQQRRVFFELQVNQTKVKLAATQQSLEASGFNAGALRAEPKAAAETYARLKAELTSTQLRLDSARQALTDNAPEVQQLLARLSTLRVQLQAMESSVAPELNGGYLSKFRDFKYQEALFELFSRQYELARLDESKEGLLIQVIDQASPPEKKSFPKRGMITALGAAFGLLGWLGVILLKPAWQRFRTSLAAVR